MTAGAHPPTRRGAWPVCADHPRQPLTWRRDGFGWRCRLNAAAGEATPQPWQPGPRGKGAEAITPKGRPWPAEQRR